MRLVPAFAMLTAAACQDDPNEDSGAVADDDTGFTLIFPECLTDPITLTPGTGWDEFTPLTEGDPVTMWHGLDSGWYFEIAGEARNTRQYVSVLTVVTALDASMPSVIAGADGAGDTYNIALGEYDEASCGGAFWGLRIWIGDNLVVPSGDTVVDAICDLEGQHLEIAITLTEIDADAVAPPARTVTSTVIATAALDPLDVELDLCN